MSSHSIRSSMSYKARFSSACTRRILCCLLEACSWFLEVRATRRDSCDDVIPNWWLFPIYRQHILHPEHLRARRQTLLCSSAQDARGGVQGGRGRGRSRVRHRAAFSLQVRCWPTPPTICQPCLIRHRARLGTGAQIQAQGHICAQLT